VDAITSLQHFIPELILLGTAFAVLFLDLLIPQKKALSVFALLGIGMSLTFLRYPEVPLPLFFGFFVVDPFSFFFKIVALGVVALTLLASLAYEPWDPQGKRGPLPYSGEYTTLFLFMAFGLILMGSSTNLLMIFLSIEFVSLLSYLLTGFLKKNSRSKEAALKYLLFGSLSSGIMLYGMSILFGLTGEIDLALVQEKLAQNGSFDALALSSLLLILVGLGFKISMAPFHLWAPDVYEGAPTPVTGFLTVGPKALGFAVILRVLGSGFPELQGTWGALLAALSMLTMTIGNVVAISQTNIKRLLAYSSIAQAGYILMGLAVSNEIGIVGVLIYLIAYALTNLGAFLCVISASNHFGTDELESYAGLGQRSPFLAFSLTLFLLSLAGIPPLAGFIGKFFVFASAIQGRFFTLAIVAALNSAVAAFYYFKIVRQMYLVPATSTEPLSHPAPLWIALMVTLAGVILLGLLPSPFITFVEQALI
jgi:proton-translocating NADH-quinone oxidoreductase chain N